LKLVLDAIDGAPGVAVFVLWIAMLDGDTLQAAKEAANCLNVDASVRHYWEEEGWPVSARLRPVLGIGPYDPTQSAWDIHLLFPTRCDVGRGRPAFAYSVGVQPAGRPVRRGTAQHDSRSALVA